MSNENAAPAREEVTVTTFSPATLTILKNFAQINKGLLFKPGQKLRTISEMKTIYAEAEIQENIPQEFAIYDLNGWLSVVSLFKEPSFQFFENNMTIKEKGGRSSVTYHYAGQGMVQAPPDKKLKLPDQTIKFNISEENLGTLQKAASVLQLSELVIESDGVNIRLGAENKKEKQGNNYFLDVDGDTSGLRCKMLLKIENLKLLKGGYQTTLGRGLANFSHAGMDLHYWVCAEAGSKFNDEN